jgi:hypothetical protein
MSRKSVHMKTDDGWLARLAGARVGHRVNDKYQSVHSPGTTYSTVVSYTLVREEECTQYNWFLNAVIVGPAAI